MGAEQFTNIVMGKTMGEAFDKAVEKARYDYGHAGYTGSIAEKHSFREFRVPALPEGVPVTAVADLNLWDDPGTRTFYVGEMVDGAWRSRTVPCPDALFERLRPMVECADDKWGDAVGIDITDTDTGRQHVQEQLEYLKRQREASGFFREVNGKRVRIGEIVPTTDDEFSGQRVFLFFGFASS